MDKDRLRHAQPEALRMVRNSYERGRLSHAYIFEGDAGTMKLDAALFFAALLLCEAEEERPCGRCSACRRIEHQTHPNVLHIRSEKQQVKKESVQRLQDDFSKTALESGQKIYIIENADFMTPHAANALLKFLEEPHPDIHGILLAEDAASLLPTIRSRAQIVPFHPLPRATIETTLLEEGYEAFHARLASELKSTPEEARSLLSDERIPDMADLVETVYRALLEDDSPLLAFEARTRDLGRDRDALDTLLALFILYQKDLIYDKIENRNQIVYAEHIDTLERLAETFTLEGLIEVLERMLTLQARQRNYVNFRLAFDNILLLMERRYRHESD